MADREHRPWHEQVAATIIEALERGTAPWVHPWEPGLMPSPPVNALTGKPYRGVNQLWLSMQQYGYDKKDPRWCTYKQAQQLGAQVKKGARGTLVQYWKQEERRLIRDEQGRPVLDEQGGKRYEIISLERPRVFHAVVFHASQIDGLPALPEQEAGENAAFERHQAAERLLENSGASIFHDQANQAFYRPVTDEIHLPEKGQFRSPDGYYATALHELGHWTGHESRLNRQLLGNPFGSAEYAREELRAEIASYMLGMELGIGHDPGQHHAYIESWIRILEDDPLEIIRAARDADQIRGYIMGLEKEKTTERGAQRPSAEHYSAAGENIQVAGDATPEEARMIFEKLAPHLSSDRTVSMATTEGVMQHRGERMTAREKTWLNVPYVEKDQAREAGAKWDGKEKRWYAPAGTDLQPLQPWLSVPEKSRTQSPAVLDPCREFGEVLRAAGLVIEGDPVMDGQIHRVPVAGGRPGAKDGAYSGHEDGRPNGWWQNYRSGERGKWLATAHLLTSEAKAILRQESAEKLADREELRKEDQARAMKRAYAKWMHAEPASPDHPYLTRKGVAAYNLRQDKHGNLLVPGYDGQGRLQTLEYINKDGAKWYEKDCPKKGAMAILPDQDALKGEVILMVEGYATGASVHQATGLPVAVAFDAGNIKDAALAIRRQMPHVKLTICADNDARISDDRNVGVLKAKEAAAAVGAKVVVADFSKSEQERRLTDFNDLHQARGLGAVRDSIMAKVNEVEAEKER
ncbi:zincin-like metallopeptidase domain-containing protein [Desulfobulbus oralis]|uniref:Toprim domain-containing protein n=1 Tax=Desulfobulbus oralis TaxID=1986146 RepID=A0A2L1GL73_9BACT|nr:zincin-like metallopeptidase domain-containing protein [Desulfobulbus oralis]AVD70425.1 hypothetical protein CAY53_02145 [Desulfobulbus oralis]